MLVSFNPQKQGDEPADFPHVGILRSAHQQGIGVAGSDFRGELIRRRTGQRLLQEDLALRLASLGLSAQDVPQELTRPLARDLVLLGNLGVTVILFRLFTLLILEGASFLGGRGSNHQGLPGGGEQLHILFDSS